MTHWRVLLGIGGGIFLGLSWIMSPWIIRRDPDPPQLSGPMPNPINFLDAWPADQVTWTDRPSVAHYDPRNRQITLSRQWGKTSPLVACHVVAHERWHADQPRWRTQLAGWHIGCAISWGIVGGIAAQWWPEAIWGAAVVQWFWDVGVRQRGEWEADAGAVQRITAAWAPSCDHRRVEDWGQRLAQRHRLALAFDGVGWSGLTIIIAVLIVRGFHVL